MRAATHPDGVPAETMYSNLSVRFSKRIRVGLEQPSLQYLETSVPIGPELRRRSFTHACWFRVKVRIARKTGTSERINSYFFYGRNEGEK